MESHSTNSFSPGDRVILRSSGECGVVVWVWISNELGGMEDCYVAFFGDSFPAGDAPPRKVPYVLRYAATSLRRAD
jgi:hypothetical protein